MMIICNFTNFYSGFQLVIPSTSGANGDKPKMDYLKSWLQNKIRRNQTCCFKVLKEKHGLCETKVDYDECIHKIKKNCLGKKMKHMKYESGFQDPMMVMIVIRLQRWQVTIPSLDQWWKTIENHRFQWLPDPKTIKKPLISMVGLNHSIQW